VAARRARVVLHLAGQEADGGQSERRRLDLEAGVPKVLFELRIPGPPRNRNSYVVAAADQRFLINSTIEESNATPISVVVNWTADLKR
jgi:hypothetical protein